MFGYCGNNPVTRLDVSGLEYIENHQILETSSNGFTIRMSNEFNDPYYCLRYSHELVSERGYNGTYLGMDAERIALEIYSHAFLYDWSIWLIQSPYESTDYWKYHDTSLPGIGQHFQKKLGEYLFIHSNEITVNADESRARVFIYKTIWYNNTSSLLRGLNSHNAPRAEGPMKKEPK